MIKSETRTSKVRDVFKKVLRPGILGLICLVSVTSANTPDSTAFKIAADEATQLIKQVDKLDYDGKYLKAVPLAEKAVAIRERIFGTTHVETAAALDTLCLAYRHAGRYVDARHAIEIALPIRERKLGPNHPETARSLNNLGAVLYLLGDYRSSELYYKRALEIRESVLGRDHIDTTTSMGNLGDLYGTLGDNTKAQRLIKNALSIRERVNGNSPETAEMLGRYAGTVFDSGNFREAEAIFAQSNSMFEKTLGPNHPRLAGSYYSLGFAAYKLGAYKRAEELLLQSLSIHELNRDARDAKVATTLNGLGLLYARIGEYVKAEAFFQRAISLKRQSTDAVVVDDSAAINNLGELYLSMGRVEDARDLLEQSLATKKTLLGNSHTRVAITLQNLATVFRVSGDLVRAEALFKKSLEIKEASLGKDHQFNSETLVSLGSLSWQRGKLQDALVFYARAQANHAQNADRILATLSESRNYDYVRTLAYDTHRFISFSIANQTRAGIKLGLDAALLYKARALDSISNANTRFRNSNHPEVAALFDQRSQLVNSLSALAYGNANASSFRREGRQIRQLEIEQEALAVELIPRTEDVPPRVSRNEPNFQLALPERSAFLEWFRYFPFDPNTLGVNGTQLSSMAPARYAVFIIRSDGEIALIDIGSAERIEVAVTELRTALSRPGQLDLSANIRLGHLLFSQLEKHLTGVNRLLVAPDGLLNLVPFSALVDGRGLLLNSRFEISYLTSARDLLRKKDPATHERRVVVVANPLFGSSRAHHPGLSNTSSFRSADIDRSGFEFRPLTNSQQEADALGMLLGSSSSVLTGEQANETVLKGMKSPSILHIASHGFFLSDKEFYAEIGRKSDENEYLPFLENPLLRSGIALAGANARKSGEHDDGILTALEVAQLDLSGTELVVLSACDSGIGEIRNGEGVYGLRRALVLAGAETQVTSLWKVSDEATRILMVSFYEKLLKGEGRSEALRHAQLELMQNPKYSHPYYWASFLPIGDWTPLRSFRQTSTQARTH